MAEANKKTNKKLMAKTKDIVTPVLNKGIISSQKSQLPVEQNDVIIYTSKDGKSNVALMTREGKVWLTQKQMAQLFATSAQNIGQHVAKVLADKELDADSVIKQFFTTASDGKQYSTYFYSLDMIMAVGYKVRGVRGVQFRQWATRHLSEYLVKGFTMDDERLKNPDGRPDYFDELLDRIRDIRTSEYRFYQKLRRLFSLSSDYEVYEKATQMFFAETQNKLLYAVTHHTAAELVLARANADEPNMGLTTWKGGIVRKGDIIVAKNYLREDEIDLLNRLTMLFLESAEIRVKSRKDLTLDYWRNTVDSLLESHDQDVLVGNGSVSNEQMERQVRAIYERFDHRRKALAAVQEDAADEKLLLIEYTDAIEELEHLRK